MNRTKVVGETTEAEEIAGIVKIEIEGTVAIVITGEEMTTEDQTTATTEETTATMKTTEIETTETETTKLVLIKKIQ